ncbi:bactofilin family protein [Albidovulum sp.]
MTRSVIEEDLTIDGNIVSDKGEIEVKGKVNGDIASREVDVLPSGMVEGAIVAEAVKVQGRHTGRIECSELVLQKDAEVKADVRAKRMSSEIGARLVGKVQITGS